MIPILRILSFLMGEANTLHVCSDIIPPCLPWTSPLLGSLSPHLHTQLEPVCIIFMLILSSYSEILQSTTTLSAGDKDQFPIQGIQHHSTSCLELSGSSYKKFWYHHHLQGTSENWTVLCCIRHGLTFLLPPTPRHTALPKNVCDTDIHYYRKKLLLKYSNRTQTRKT